MEEKRYLACVSCDDAVKIVGEGSTPASVFNFLDLHTHEKNGDKHLLMCFEHEYVYKKKQPDMV